MACIIAIKEELNNSIDKILGGYRDATHSYKEAQKRSSEINDRWSNLSRVEKFGDDRAKVDISDRVFEEVANEALELQNQLDDELSSELDMIEKLTNIKPGVEELFNSNPELAKIGTQQQYSQYLDTKDTPIVYHGSPEYFEKFDESKLGTYTGAASAKQGIFFGGSKDVSRSYLDKRGETLNINELINHKYGNLKNLSEKAVAIQGGFEEEIKDIGWVQENYVILHNGDLIFYDENGDLWFRDDIDNINSPKFLKILEEEKRVNSLLNKSYNTLESIKSLLKKENIKDSVFYKSYLLRETHLKNTYDTDAGAYLDKDRNITDKPFEDLFIRPFSLKLKNPYIVSDEGLKYREETYYERIIKAKELGHDGVIIKDTYDSKFQTKPEDVYVVFKTNQIEELGNKQDIEKFKKYVQGKTTKVKKGVQDLFESNPVLASIGTPQQYSTYLDTIFPDSTNKFINYHGTEYNQKFEKFDSKLSGSQTAIGLQTPGFWFTYNKDFAEDFGENIISVMVNVKNTYNAKSKLNDTGLRIFLDQVETVNEALQNGYDSVLIDVLEDLESGKGQTELVVFNPEQIHILGSNQDIEGFNQFVSELSDEQTEEELEEEYPIQTAYKKELEKTGSKPKVVLIKGTKAILNDNGTYDIIDPSNNFILQKNIDLDTMQIVPSPDSFVPYDNKVFDDFVRNTMMHPYTEPLLAEKGIDINDIFDQLGTISTKEELNNIIGKILKNIC